MSEMTLAEYKAKVDAKYAGMREQQRRREEAERVEKAELARKDHWLLVRPDGEVDGVMSRRFCKSAAQAFEEFFPKKKERHQKSAEGWRIEIDDVDGSRWQAACDRWLAEEKGKVDESDS